MFCVARCSLLARMALFMINTWCSTTTPTKPSCLSCWISTEKCEKGSKYLHLVVSCFYFLYVYEHILMRFFFLHITIINCVVYYMYVCDAQKARAVAVAGYLWVLKHHRSVNLVDYIMRTVHHRQQEWGVVVE